MSMFPARKPSLRTGCHVVIPSISSLEDLHLGISKETTPTFPRSHCQQVFGLQWWRYNFHEWLFSWSKKASASHLLEPGLASRAARPCNVGKQASGRLGISLQRRPRHQQVPMRGNRRGAQGSLYLKKCSQGLTLTGPIPSNTKRTRPSYAAIRLAIRLSNFQTPR